MSRLVSLLCLVLAATACGRGALAGECFADWSVASPIVKKEGLLSVEELTPLVKRRMNGDVVKVTLCQEGSGYVFRLVIKDGSGNLKTVTVDAKNPF